MTSLASEFKKFFVSLTLTVVLLSLSIGLVFMATLHQVHLGIYGVLMKYFRSFFVVLILGDEISLARYCLVIGLALAALGLIRLLFYSEKSVRTILPPALLAGLAIYYSLPAVLCFLMNQPVPVPVYPGGYLIGGFLLTNLIAAHIYRLKLTWEKVGIQLAHAGLILLLVGELITGLLQRDSVMELTEGTTKNYSQSFRDHELVLIDHSNPDYDETVAIPAAVLADQATIQHPKLPFLVQVREFYPNATLQPRDANSPAVAAGTTGPAARFALVPLPLSYKETEPNQPAARLELTGTEGPLGTWLASPQISMPQTFTAAGRTWSVALRIRRHYQPFSVTLLKVTHEIYPGTEIPKNFASRVRVKSDDGHEDRETTIFMNNPLRFGGLTFYQYQMNAAGQMSAFQVVSNPGWLLPYIACVMMALGLIWQFLASLGKFINRRSQQTNP